MIQPISSSLFHRILLPEKSTAALHPTIIYIHGRGADEEDLLGLSGALDERLLSISVRAPHTFEGGGYTWYEILEMGKPDHEMFKASYEKLCLFIQDAMAHYPIDPTRMFLFGFSMGTVMSYALELTYPKMFAGVIANSGYLAEDTYLQLRWNEVKDKDLFIAHGRQDPMIPIEAARRARLLFENARALVTYKEYDMGHQISEQSLADISAWLNQHLDSQSS